MARRLLIGFAILLGVVFYTAPATLFPFVIGGDRPLHLTKVEGSLWMGSAVVLFKNWPIGQLNWSFEPRTLLDGAIGFAWVLAGSEHEASGQVKVDFNHWSIMATGTVHSASIQRILKPYYIDAGGQLTITRLDAYGTNDENSPTYSGALNWTGGEVRYQLSRRKYKVTLPSLSGSIETINGEPTLIAHAQGNELPLLKIKIDHEGWANVGITKEFMKIIGQPWSGKEPKHAVVLEVGEQLL
jgi:hypothetical protein